MTTLFDAQGKPIKRVDCTVEVNRIETHARHCTNSWLEWNLPEYLATFEKRMVAILKDHGGQMHYTDFLKEYKRRYEHG